jgi:hypothetical protein
MIFELIGSIERHRVCHLRESVAVENVQEAQTSEGLSQIRPRTTHTAHHHRPIVCEVKKLTAN